MHEQASEGDHVKVITGEEALDPAMIGRRLNAGLQRGCNAPEIRRSEHKHRADKSCHEGEPSAVPAEMIGTNVCDGSDVCRSKRDSVGQKIAVGLTIVLAERPSRSRLYRPAQLLSCTGVMYSASLFRLTISARLKPTKPSVPHVVSTSCKYPGIDHPKSRRLGYR